MTTPSEPGAPCFLVIGLSWSELAKMVDSDEAAVSAQAARVKAALARGEQQFRDVGYGYQVIHYGPEEGMARLVAILQSRSWAGVCIGLGIRSNAQYTPLFEALVNTIHETSPTSKLLFNTRPDDTMVAVRRWFPETPTAH